MSLTIRPGSRSNASIGAAAIYGEAVFPCNNLTRFQRRAIVFRQAFRWFGREAQRQANWLARQIRGSLHAILAQPLLNPFDHAPAFLIGRVKIKPDRKGNRVFFDWRVHYLM